MLCDLIIDGNYILSKLVFTLHKNNILYGSLYNSLENTILGYRKIYPFRKIYLVSDSKEKSWRKNLKVSYKSTRKRDSSIDWNFVYNTYQEFKDSLSNIKVLEESHVEGDDWISFLCEKSNSIGISNIIISNDYDIKQLIRFNLDPLWINIMYNGMYFKNKIFIPRDWKIFKDKISKLEENNDIFNLNYNNEFIIALTNLVESNEVKEVDYIESLIIKLITGDKSDNISSVWSSKTKNGTPRGIGERGAQSIYNNYIEEFGNPSIKDVDLYENIADIICEKKKISKTNIEKIVKNIESNSKLIDLRTENLPKEIFEKMEIIYNKL